MDRTILNENDTSTEVQSRDIENGGTMHTKIFDIPAGDVIDNCAEDFNFDVNNNKNIEKSSSTIPTLLNTKPRYGISPFPAPALEAFITVTKWRGEVKEIHNDTVQAKVTLVDDNDAELLEDSKDYIHGDYLEFSRNEIPPDERNLVIPGAKFNWHIGHAITRYGQIKNQDIIVFLTHPSWTNDYVKKIEEESIDLLNYLNTDSE